MGMAKENVGVSVSETGFDAGLSIGSKPHFQDETETEISDGLCGM
jgi:hypothetical protein